MESSEQYGRCLVLAGGGFRFAYYLGVHAAAVDAGRPPDVVLASCGGAIAAAAIAALPDAAARREWVAGPAMYRFLCGIGSTPRAAPLHALGGAMRRCLDRRPAARIPDLFDDYLFELHAALPLPPRPEEGPAPGAPAIAIVGARLLFGPHEAGMARDGRTLFEETVFCAARAAALLDDTPAPAADGRWSAGAVAPHIRADSAMPWPDAVRISIADMVYFRCHAHADQFYTGGVIDLFPIELAQRLAREVVMERKGAPGRWLMLPAWRTVLGIDGAARLAHVHGWHADAWVDTADVSQALRGHGVRKRIDWRANRIRLAPPASQADYAAQAHAQWDYGYRKGMAAFNEGNAR